MPGAPRIGIVTLMLLFAAAVGLQAARERLTALQEPAESNLLYIQSGEVLRRAALSYDALLADVYWIRALQHYGRTKLSADHRKEYALLHPLLDLTTTLDPRFDIAYRFGAIFLAENQPGGAGRPDLAVTLLEKGLRAQPGKWQFAQDVGFVHYWWRQDYEQAAEWFQRAADMPNAPSWMAPLAAVTLAQGGNRESSRQLWWQLLESGEAEWLRAQARFRLTQLDAMDQIDALVNVTRTFGSRTGSPPPSWSDLVRAGYLTGVPVDPEGFPYRLDPHTGDVTLALESPLNPLPVSSQPSR